MDLEGDDRLQLAVSVGTFPGSRAFPVAAGPRLPHGPGLRSVRHAGISSPDTGKPVYSRRMTNRQMIGLLMGLIVFGAILGIVSLSALRVAP